MLREMQPAPCDTQQFWSFAILEELMLKHMLLRFYADQSGATAIEYGLIAAGISLAIIAAVNGLGSTLNTSFATLNTSLK